ncbi:MAG: hypothetical protein EYC70_14485 [Planctomycetota bacterium]|nr:MAG: hypothetical protein EYC70_14485 [Planctomycetota bacterium]
MAVVRPRTRWLLLLTAAAGCADEAASGPDLILVSVDTLRADRLSAYGAARDCDGDPAAPWSVRGLAARGVTYEWCWAAAGQTVPSLGSFWTGKPPLEHGGITNLHPVQLPSRAERLQEQGYVAHARVANRCLTPGIGLNRGFDSYAIRFGPDEAGIPAELAGAASATIRNGQSLLLWAHFMTPHQPYSPPPPNDRRYTERSDPQGSNDVLAQLHRSPELADAATVEHLRGLYDGEVRSACGYVEDLLERLDAEYRKAGRGGLLDNAVVVFFADHGEELADHHAYFMHAKSLYSGVIRVPLIIAGRGFPSGRREPRPLGLWEVLSVVLDGAQPDAGPHCAAWKARFYSVRDERWTLVHNPCHDRNGPLEPPEDVPFYYEPVALYDRLADPTEQHDVAAQHPQETLRLLAALRDWYGALHVLPVEDAALDDAPSLQELGYADVAGGEADCPPWPPQRWEAPSPGAPR